MALEATVTSDENIYDVLIIGGGPAGLTAGFYVRRAGLKAGFVERDVPGGRLAKIDVVENFSGFTNISGPDLALKMYEQADANKVEYVYGNVVSVTYKKEIKRFIVYTEDGTSRLASAVIVATGGKENKLNVKNEDQYLYKGISFCSICDGPFTKGKDVVVVGGGNSATNSVIYLSKIAKSIKLLNRTENFKSEKTTLEKIKKLKNVKVLTNTIVTEVIGDGKTLTGVKSQNVKTKKIENIKCDYMFEFIGATPVTEFLPLDKIENEKGFLIVNDKMQTNMPGLYGCGDCIKKGYRQITTSVGDGTVAALSAINYINNVINK